MKRIVIAFVCMSASLLSARTFPPITCKQYKVPAAVFGAGDQRFEIDPQVDAIAWDFTTLPLLVLRDKGPHKAIFWSLEQRRVAGSKEICEVKEENWSTDADSALSPDGCWKLTNNGKSLTLSEVAQKSSFDLAEHSKEITAFSWSPDGNYFASVAVDELRIWDVTELGIVGEQPESTE